MSSVRELLETAAPPAPRPTSSSAEVRSLGDRRRRRSQVVGAVVAVTAVTAAAMVGVRVLAPAAPRQDRAVATTPTPTPTPTSSQTDPCSGGATTSAAPITDPAIVSAPASTVSP